MIVPETRRQARELALQVLFQQEFSPTLPLRDGLNTFRGNFHATQDVWDYAEYLLKGVDENKKNIDSLIQKSSAHWTLERMALVELNIMRIATFEIAFSQQEVPPKTAINEAIEISKKYGSTDSGAFVNGILDQVRKTGIT
ncbi:MAG: transcription antitermination factor NusB [Bdellovibrionales bacterium]|nr:transcription antitermination factor NusB [Bdellovibrionales bacterium]